MSKREITTLCLLLSMYFSFLLALLISQPAHPRTILKGHISTEKGVIGCTVSHRSYGISSIIKGSPAEDAGLKLGDIIVTSDAKPGPAGIFGEPYTYVTLVIKRGSEVFIKEVVRREESVIYNFGTKTYIVKEEVELGEME